MSITNNGMHIVTAAHDRTIRLWERTEEPLILDEEKEQVIGWKSKNKTNRIVVAISMSFNHFIGKTS